MAELNFVIDQNALATVKNTVISANFEEMKEALTEFAEPYKNVLVTEDAIGIAKADRAKIRSVAKHIDDYRKNVKSVYSEPLKQFEAKCKELTAICDEASSNIDVQIKAYEQKRKDEKLFLIHEYFDNAQKNMKYPEYLTWEYVLNDKWANVTYPIETAHKDIDTAVLQCDRDVQSIIDLSSEFQLSLLDNYKATHDYFGTMSLQERLASQKLREEQKQRELEARYEKERRERVAKEKAAEKNPALQPKKEEAIQKYVADVRIYGSYDEINMIMQFLNNEGIHYSLDNMKPFDKPPYAAF